MSNKTKIRILIGIIIILIAIIIGLVIYFFYGNIQSKPPEIIVKEYEIKEENYKNRRVFIANSKNEKSSGKVILYIHGGSYAAELQKEHWRFIKDIIKDTNATIIVPDYPLVPQYDYTDVFKMMLPLYKEITQKVQKENLILLGDSAGGGMALALIEKAGEENLMQPSKTILISPWLDATMSNEKINEVQKKDKILNKDLLKIAGISYAGSEEQAKNYLISPIYGPLEKLENVIIYTGTNDIFNPDVHKLQQLAAEKNVNIKIRETQEAVHIWILQKYINSKYDNKLARNAYQDLIQEIQK